MVLEAQRVIVGNRTPEPGVAIRPHLASHTLALLRAILQSSNDGILLTDLEHRSLACNEAFGRMFEIDPAMVVQSNPKTVREAVYRIIPDPASWEDRLDEIYADPEQRYEDELALSTSPPRFLSRITGPVWDEDGNLIGRMWTFRDVTRQRRRRDMAERLTEISTMFNPDPIVAYRSILSVISEFYGGAIAVLSLLRDGFMHYAETVGMPEELKAIQGLPLEQTYCNFVIGQDGPLIIQDARTNPEWAETGPAKLGANRYLGCPIHDPSGIQIGTVCFVDNRVDETLDQEDGRFMSLMAMRISAELARERYLQEQIAEREAAIEQQKADLETTNSVLAAMNQGLMILRSTPNMGQLVDQQMRLLQGLLGYHSAALITRKSDGFMLRLYQDGKSPYEEHEIDVIEVPKLMALFDHPQLGRDLVVDSAQATEPLRSLMKSDVVTFASLVQENHPTAFLAMGGTSEVDMSDPRHRSHLEALAEQMNLLLAANALQMQLIETTDELRNAQRQLVQSEKLSVVGTLAASTAHDIRNILASLSMELSFADDPIKSLDAVRANLDRFAVLSHRLLSYAKPRMVAKQQVDLKEILQRVLTLTAAQLRVSNVQVVTESAEDLQPVIGDLHQIEHLFINLVLNAVQAMEPHGGSLTVTALAAGSSVEISFRDTGKGIPHDSLQSLFQPFASTRSEGFGLGLYSCRRIVEEHEGDIAVASEPGRGTTFTIRIPAARRTRS
ncbi:MAG: Adaptive-response sensory-kinase SasA [Fimbriimonadaceae bacterium]|nr:Adaptive-response sensory-kinase SasA [Fimbriimonadaceae bacterium]